jgi:hypothetical protein
MNFLLNSLITVFDRQKISYQMLGDKSSIVAFSHILILFIEQTVLSGKVDSVV